MCRARPPVEARGGKTLIAAVAAGVLLAPTAAAAEPARLALPEPTGPNAVGAAGLARTRPGPPAGRT
ncbi:hypothetical protein FDZ84_12780 [Saccharopolyspora sp. ASAGF58]|nr:hypothetical protein FDZ84_12780 [Saccharopolyspora sp. ASAGF58]